VIRDRSEERHTFQARHFAEQVGEHPVSTNGHRSELTDEEVEQLARGARNGAKFEALTLVTSAATSATARQTRLMSPCSHFIHRMRSN